MTAVSDVPPPTQPQVSPQTEAQPKSNTDPAPASPAPKAAPDSFALRGRPRPVKQLSRRALAALIGGAAAIVGAGGLWALRPPAKSLPKTDLYNTDHKPTAEGLAALPTSYANAPAAQATTPPGVPKLGPALPGDLGAPILRAQHTAMLDPAMSTDPTQALATTPPSAAETHAEVARQLGLQQTQAALASGLFTGAGHTGPEAVEAAIPPSPGGDVAAPPVPNAAPASDPGSGGPHANFMKADATAESITVSPHRLTLPASPFIVMAGSTIAAALVTGLNSDLPGQVIATVTAPVYDSPTGRLLLIPQGSRLLGLYDAGVSFGESRALLVWTRLILPNGASVILDKTPATDAAGYAGVSDQVDNHWKQLVAGAAFTTLLGAGAELAAPQNQTSGSNTVVVATRESLQDSVNQVGQELTRKTLSIKPTLTVRPGYPVRVLVNRDLVLRPYIER